MTIHANSISAWRELDLERREREVMSTIEEIGHACTDREIMRTMRRTDPNSVRPRVTKLVENGLLEEVGTYMDDQTKRPCRMVWFGNGTPKEKGPTLMSHLLTYFRQAERERAQRLFPSPDWDSAADSVNRLL